MLVSNETLDIVLEKLHRIEEQNRALIERVAFLERELAKYKTKKTSRNSSKPPSQDFPGIKRTRSLRKSSGLAPGGQPGHTGSTLQRTSHPDLIVEHKPESCEKCGSDLSQKSAEQVGDCQTVDIPEINPIRTEHQIFETRCSCGHCNRASQPHRGVVYGPRIRAFISYLSVAHHMPYARIAQMLKETYGLSLSEGSIDNILKNMGERSTDLYDQIREKVVQSEVVGSDETGFRVNGKLHWVWTWQSPEATYLSVSESRGKQAVAENFPEGFGGSTLVHDRLASQVNTEAGEHQFCMAHILRELKYIQEATPENMWAHHLESLLQETIHFEKELGRDFAERELMRRDAEDALERILAQQAYGEESQRLRKSLTKHRDKLWHYIMEESVPATNNASERALRNLKVKQKVSTSMRTLLGAKIFCKLRSIAETCTKQGTSFFETLNQLALQLNPG